MRRIMLPLICATIVKTMSASDAHKTQEHIPRIIESADTSSLDTFIFILTLIVAIIAFLFAVISIFEFTKVEKTKKKLDSFNNKMDEIRTVMAIHNRTMQQINEFLYKATLRIAESTNSKDLLEEVTLNYHISTLYSSNFDSDDNNSINKKNDAFNYIQEKGHFDDIRYLEYIADHDTDRSNRIRARKVIGHIEEREKKSSDYGATQVNKNKVKKHWLCSFINSVCTFFKKNK